MVAGLSRRYSRWEFALARYRPDGRLLAGFGKGGLVLTQMGRGTNGVYAVAEQPGGNLVAVGGAYTAPNQSGFGVVRYTPRGRLDLTFGSRGKVITTFARPGGGRLAYGSADDVALQPDGRIVAAGNVTNVVDESKSVLVRYTTRGALDTSFGTGGKTLSTAAVGAVALQPDGKIVIAGSGATPSERLPHFLVARLTRRGRIDRSFGSGGSVVTTLGDFGPGSDVAIQPDGRIVLVGRVAVRGRYQLGLVRYLPSGRSDSSFGANGTVVTNFAVYDSPALALQPDGKIVAACGLSSPNRFGVARYTADGKLDPTFGEGGRVRTRFPERSVARDVAITPDGKILVAGSTGGDFALARYTRDGSLDPSFGADGLVRTPLGPAWLRKRSR